MNLFKFDNKTILEEESFCLDLKKSRDRRYSLYKDITINTKWLKMFYLRHRIITFQNSEGV